MKSELVEAVLKQLRNGKGAGVFLKLSVTKSFRVVFIPSPLYSDNPNELLIACEGAGVYFYDGQYPLNEFLLISARFPIDIAKQVAELVGHIMKQAKQQSPTLPTTEPKQLQEQ